MTIELDRVRDVRPTVPAASEKARVAARRRLMAAIEDEPAGLHDRRGRDRRRHDGDRDAGRWRAGRRGVSLGGLASVAAGLVAVAVAVGAIALLGHHGHASGHGSAQGGSILAAGGQQLTGADIAPAVSAGLRATYDRRLHGGDSLRTSIDLALQRTAQRSLAHSIAVNHAVGGSFVAMNPDTGAIAAIGSLFARATHGPARIDGAIGSAGPVGSTFAPVTVLAALQSGAWAPAESYDDTGEFCVGSGVAQQCRHNAGHAAFGAVSATAALRVQDDLFLDDLGAKTNADPLTHPAGGALQAWSHALGIGQPTGVDLPGAVSGTLPTPAWRARRNRLESECDHAVGPFRGGRRHPPGGCGIADGSNRPWSIGDNINLAGGQGDVQVSPLQLAVAYAAIANGGTIVSPHVGAALIRPDGTTARTIAPPPVRRVRLSALDLSVVRRGLRANTSAPGGASSDVFHELKVPVSGAVGTAQTVAGGRVSDDAWYAGYVPAGDGRPPLVVVVWIPGGGYGDVAAAPVARQIVSQWFTGAAGRYVPGHDTAS